MTIRRLFFTTIIIYFVCGFASISSASSQGIAPRPGDVTQVRQYKVELILAGMSLEEKIGQLFIIAADGDLEKQIRAYHIGGVVLFSRHTETLSRTMTLIEKIRQSMPLPAFIAVDQEGGRVSRLSFATAVPNARSLGTLSDFALQNIGTLVGRELHSLGFNLNFAPVLDVDTCAENPVIGERSFSDDPYLVAKLGSAYIRGLHNSGILAAAKHFPGHGDTGSDSHFVLPVVNQTRERLHAVEMLPFRAARLAGVDMIMVAHVHYPELDPTPNLPATLSKPIITGLLRQEMDFNGIIITDAMNMMAITDRTDLGQGAKAAFQAGADLILMPDHLSAAYYTLLSSIRTGEIPVARVDESVRRILSLKLQLPKEPKRSFDARLKHASVIVRSPSHKAWLDQILSEKTQKE